MPYKDIKKRYENQQSHRDSNFAKLWEILCSSSCMDCGLSDPRVLEFDHRRDKKFNVSKAVGQSTRSWKSIQEEINKCDIVCANCHTIRTQERGNYKRNQAFVAQRKSDTLLR